MDRLKGFAEDARRAVASGLYGDVPSDAPGRPGPSLAKAIASAPRALIAEMKPASPSGPLRTFEDAGALGRTLLDAGARGLSVLTESRTFHGSLRNLARAARLGAPVLMKDFVVDERQIDAAKACGASAVLLILPLHAERMARMDVDAAIAAAHARGLETLLEVYDAGGLDAAFATRTDMVGFNNRDLRDLSVDLARFAPAMAGRRKDRPVIALSGVETRRDADALFAAGADAVLVGSALMRAPDPAVVVKELVG